MLALFRLLMVPRPELQASIARAIDLDGPSLDAMWGLFTQYYEDVTREAFERDLREKEHVIVLRRTVDDTVQGFSTITTFERVVDGKPVVGVFSGDTIVAKQHWNQTALQRAFLTYVMRVKMRNPYRPVYWFLISKGFRTYLLLARNFPEYWPRHDKATPRWQTAVIDDFSRTRFGKAFIPELGILRFDKAAGRLKENVAPIDERARTLPEVRFFEQRNPEHAKGCELCCIGRVDGHLWTSYMLKLARRSLGLR